jgi:hypothetical protein
VAAAIASLGATIWYAEGMGEHYDLAHAGWITPVHLWIAKTTTLAYLLPITTGILTCATRAGGRVTRSARTSCSP